jgi:aspartate kinase
MTAMKHSVEKIGGTSMSQYQAVLDNIWLRPRSVADQAASLYQRIFVVSAYAGITNGLLEHKKNGEAGVYALFAEMDDTHPWQARLDQVLGDMLDKNREMFGVPGLNDDGLLQRADRFISERVADVHNCLEHLEAVCCFGHFQLDDHLHRVREMLSALGEAHSAWNSVLLLRQHNINARFIDLTNWRADTQPDFDEHILRALQDVDLVTEMPVVTGYTQCREGLMRTYDRGYSEMTFSRIATLTGATEAVIHKEYHLSTADPVMVGADNVRPIGMTNYDVADQLANLGMEAIHPRAAAGLRKQDIRLIVKNTFEPEHSGTEIRRDYCSATPKVEIIAGTRNVWALEVFDQDMVGDAGHGQRMNDLVLESGVRVLTKDFNANTVTFYLKGNKRRINWLMDRLQQAYPGADVRVEKLAMVCAIGSDMKVPGLLQKAAGALSAVGVNILAVHQAMRQVDMMFLVSDADYAVAVRALHTCLVEQSAVWLDRQQA